MCRVFELSIEPSLKRVTSPHANLRVPARVYDVEGGAVFAKNSTFVFFDGFAWTPRLRSPSPIMAHALTNRFFLGFNAFSCAFAFCTCCIFLLRVLCFPLRYL